jgi:energy-coupling factor transport system permease protein
LIPEIRIVLYLLFIISLFVLDNLAVYLIIFVILCLFLSRLPFRTIKSGWLPISLFLMFTFFSNILNRQGRIIFLTGPLFITDEGIATASVRTLRVMFMIGGAKILMASARAEEIVNAMGRLMGPFEKTGLPIKDFFHTMGLTLKCFPILKNMVMETYRENIRTVNISGFRARAKMISAFLLPMFVRNVRNPEAFFERQKIHEE